MSTETGQTVEEKKGREAAEEASALDKLTDRVRTDTNMDFAADMAYAWQSYRAHSLVIGQSILHDIS